LSALNLVVLPDRWCVCRAAPETAVPAEVLNQPFFCVMRTHEELSLVVPDSLVLNNFEREEDWRIFQVKGPLDFALTGVLSSLTGPLAKASISIFALSTFDTDYLMVKGEKLAEAIVVLRQAGFLVSES